MPKPLSLAQHKFYVRLRREKKVRDAERLFLAEGIRTISELLKAAPQSLLALIQTQSSDFITVPSEKVFIASSKQFSALSDTEHSQGVIGIFEQPTVSPQTLFKTLETKASSVVLVLDDVQDPGNLGTLIRTAAWFGVDAVIASGGTADFFNPKVVRSTAGSLFALSLYRSASLSDDLASLQKIGFTIYGAAMAGEDFLATSFSAKTALVIGNEANGISEHVRQSLHKEITITGHRNKVESLNAAVSAGILLSRICLHK
ncbi:MAG: TrmH family RNA methyltransferase [Chloroherpetonaceae bacterium]